MAGDNKDAPRKGWGFRVKKAREDSKHKRALWRNRCSWSSSPTSSATSVIDLRPRWLSFQPTSATRPFVKTKKKRKDLKKWRKKKCKKEEKTWLRSCNRKLLLATICSSTRVFFSLCQPGKPPNWKTGQVPLMSNLFQSSRAWAWQFTERLEELVITSVTGQLMHITLRHSWRRLSAPQ